jgi:hypothetical protein
MRKASKAKLIDFIPMETRLEEQDFPHHTEILLRKPDSNKSALKEKFVAIYEAFFMVLQFALNIKLCSL